ncbi:efflux RND transporter permease subunit [Endozoicomonas elysicola]|uniref:Multidrug transporter AcrB n=1 Tax=Endozoicomonas elysicola TaxID=305900 RepID=A0A081KCI2_9GAMM|nr:efflux RND transporter permease subunit [Endozoicomonas elysicola]KEI71858.1 multidrug transporter AcrB [Endozoicomonas elysicola]
MILSDLSIKRPVFATVVSLLLITFGVVCFTMLPVRELPDITPPTVMIYTGYDGASAEVIESKITNVIEDQLGGIEGVRFIESTSRNGTSRINIEFSPDRDMETAANDVREAMSRVIWRLPDEAESPIVWKNDGSGETILNISLQSDTLSLIELTDYAERTLQDRLSLVDGVSSVDVMGAREYVMRIELDAEAMAARQITTSDVRSALRRDNVELPAGEMTDTLRTLPVRVNRDYNTINDFRRLLIRQDGSSKIYLEDIASIRTEAKEIETLAKANGRNVLSLGIVPLSQANPLEVIQNVKDEVEAFTPFLPEGTYMTTTRDSSIYIQSAIDEVYATLGMTIALVILVLYIFLGNARATLIPAVTVPVSLISAFIVIHLLGYSINLLTLLALVLAIGLVVDDAIVVLENIHQHLERGEPPLVAAWKGAREVSFAVIATTVVLVMTFVPIVFMEGSVGRLFSEYAMTLVGAVVFSSLIALTLSPMMSSQLLKLNVKPSKASQLIEKTHQRLTNLYRNALSQLLIFRWAGLVLLLASLGITALLYPMIPQTFTPSEDRGEFIVIVKGPEGANFDSMEESMLKLESKLLPHLGQGVLKYLFVRSPGWGGNSGSNSGILIGTLEDWDDRNVSAAEVMGQVRQLMAGIPNVRAIPVMRSTIGGRSEAPIQYVLGGGSFDQLVEWADIIAEKARENPGLRDVDIDFNQNQPQLEITIDRDRAQELGVSAEEIGATLETMLGGVTDTTFMERGEEYDVFLRAKEEAFTSALDLASLYVRSHTTGSLIRLDNLVTVEEVGKAAMLKHYNRNRAITISASLEGNYSIGEALAYLDQQVVDLLPPEAIVNYKGESLDYRSNQSAIFFVFAMAMLVVYLVLAAQFESFVHPLIVMLTVPLGISGALFGLYISGETLNIFSQLAMIMLIGLSAKNGILIVEFINQLRDQGMAFDEAVLEASALRLRPILMTALTTVVGAIPLLLATGAGSEFRFSIGVVVFAGVTVSSLLTLFVVPSMYALVARKTTSPDHVSRKLQELMNS